MLIETIILAFMTTEVFVRGEQSSMDEIKEKFLETCKVNGNEEHFKEVEMAGRAFYDCVNSLFDFGGIGTEYMAAVQNGGIDDVFQKYCDKTPELKVCTRALTKAIAPCLDKQTVQRLPSAQNATEELLDYICYKDGKRMSKFFSEGGIECLNKQYSTIRDCVGSFPESLVPSGSMQINCSKFDQLATCVVNAIRGCSSSTLDIMFLKLFLYARQGSMCVN